MNNNKKKKGGGYKEQFNFFLCMYGEPKPKPENKILFTTS